MIGLDTSAVIDIFKGDADLKEFLEKNDGPLATNMMNYIEVFFGIDQEKNEDESDYYREFFKTTYFINLTKEASEKASEIYFKLKEKGRIISKFDCLLTACFIDSGIKKILTRNVKHFERIEGIKVMQY